MRSGGTPDTHATSAPSPGQAVPPAEAPPAPHAAAIGPLLPSTRRSFFGVLVGSISAVVGAMMAVPLVRFALHPVLHGGGGADWFALGSPEEFAAAAEPVRAE
ncbi:MAG TPA: hypothetical protein VHG32_27695, partial [Thermoanaerobaculia bacterium]|nr:hypothetical protein [Thermoanaerobaculia bacterium]